MTVPEGPSARRPNVLLIMADQLRRDALGPYGSWAATPHVDELARTATTFDNAVTVSPACQPARISLATGHYPHNFGLWSNGPGSVAEGAPTWMSAVRDGGIGTSSFGKLHLTHSGNDLRRQAGHIQSLGFDTVNETLGPRGCMTKRTHMTEAWAQAGVFDAFRADLADRLANDPLVVRPSPLPLELYYDVYVPSQAIDHLRSLPADRPWLCNVSFGGPHEPWDAPEPYASMFSPDDAPPPIPFSDRGDATPRYFLDETIRMGGGRTPDQLAAMRANYAGAVRLIDDQIGRLLDVVRERGEWEHTVVIVTSDHGEMNGDHGRVYKGTFYTSAVAIPLIVRIPDITNGQRSRALAELHDVGATVADVCGVPLEHEQFARSLVPACADPSEPGRPVAISEYKRDYMVFDGRHRLIVNRQGESVLLFDLSDDPDEHINQLGRPSVGDVEMKLRDQLLRAITLAQLSVRREQGSKAYREQRETARQILQDQAPGETR